MKYKNKKNFLGRGAKVSIVRKQNIYSLGHETFESYYEIPRLILLLKICRKMRMFKTQMWYDKIEFSAWRKQWIKSECCEYSDILMFWMKKQT